MLFLISPQVDLLIKAGADILAPIAIGPKRVQGTAVDYAYYMFNQVSMDVLLFFCFHSNGHWHASLQNPEFKQEC